MNFLEDGKEFFRQLATPSAVSDYTDSLTSDRECDDFDDVNYRSLLGVKVTPRPHTTAGKKVNMMPRRSVKSASSTSCANTVMVEFKVSLLFTKENIRI